MAISVRVNGKREEAEAPVSVTELLERLRIRPEVCTVALNREFLKRDVFDATVARDGDSIDIMIQLAGGSDD